jgi:hypothetical protein
MHRHSRLYLIEPRPTQQHRSGLDRRALPRHHRRGLRRVLPRRRRPMAFLRPNGDLYAIAIAGNSNSSNEIFVTKSRDGGLHWSAADFGVGQRRSSSRTSLYDRRPD